MSIPLRATGGGGGAPSGCGFPGVGVVDLDSGLAAAGCELWDLDDRNDVPESLSSVSSAGRPHERCVGDGRHTLGQFPRHVRFDVSDIQCRVGSVRPYVSGKANAGATGAMFDGPLIWRLRESSGGSLQEHAVY